MLTACATRASTTDHKQLAIPSMGESQRVACCAYQQPEMESRIEQARAACTSVLMSWCPRSTVAFMKASISGSATMPSSFSRCLSSPMTPECHTAPSVSDSSKRVLSLARLVMADHPCQALDIFMR